MTFTVVMTTELRESRAFRNSSVFLLILDKISPE